MSFQFHHFAFQQCKDYFRNLANVSSSDGFPILPQSISNTNPGMPQEQNQFISLRFYSVFTAEIALKIEYLSLTFH